MTKYFVSLFYLIFLLLSCNRNSSIVSKDYADSLIANFTEPEIARNNAKEMDFWKSRINPALPGMVNESKYAATLIQRFNQFGDIKDVKEAEKIMRKVSLVYNNKEATPYVALARYAILQHRFKEADSLFSLAKTIGLRNYELGTGSFDIDFELGRYHSAAFNLTKLKSGSDFGYFFRRSKMDHLNGNIDSAVAYMLKAGKVPGIPPYIKGVALSNAADLYIHEGKMQEAYELYRQCLKLNGTDFHSITGLGWIALINDKNYLLADKLFKFVQANNSLPDPLFKLYQMAQGKGDRSLELEYARKFATRATNPVYGHIYNKYLVELYTGVLNQPAKAEEITKGELNNRATPLTYAWRAWSLFKNNKKDEAYEVFKNHVSGQPLEALELYWMGKMMQGTGKGYNAQEFFKAANTNRYDLSPGMAKDLGSILE